MQANVPLLSTPALHQRCQTAHPERPRCCTCRRQHPAYERPDNGRDHSTVGQRQGTALDQVTVGSRRGLHPGMPYHTSSSVPYHALPAVLHRSQHGGTSTVVMTCRMSIPTWQLKCECTLQRSRRMHAAWAVCVHLDLACARSQGTAPALHVGAGWLSSPPERWKHRDRSGTDGVQQWGG